MGCAVQWSPMKPESWSGWFPLKSSPTCSYRWLHCDLQNVLRKLLEMYVLTGRRHLADWLNWTALRHLLNCLEADPSENTPRNNSCIVVIVSCHGNPVYRSVAWIPICVSVTWSPVFPTCGRFPWETLSYASDIEMLCTSHTQQTLVPLILDHLHKFMQRCLVETLDKFHKSSEPFQCHNMRRWSLSVMS
jgi:hypothetical protein